MSILRQNSLFSLCFVTLALITGCAEQTEGERCDILNNSSDCESGLVCRAIANSSSGASDGAVCCPASNATASICQQVGVSTVPRGSASQTSTSRPPPSAQAPDAALTSDAASVSDAALTSDAASVSDASSDAASADAASVSDAAQN